MDGKRLEQLSNECPLLQQLRISQCDIALSTWSQVRFKELRVLHLTGADQLDESSLRAILKNCPNLFKVVLPVHLRVQRTLLSSLEKPGLSLSAWI
jgi:hypothetical protein